MSKKILLPDSKKSRLGPSPVPAKSKTDIYGLTGVLASVLQKEFPTHNIFYGSDPNDSTYVVRETFSTGLPNLDMIMGRDIEGNWGIPFGRQIEISGPESTGKSTLVFTLAGQIARLGGTVMYYDMENVLDLNYAHKFVPPAAFLPSQPDTIEEVYDEVILTIATYEKYLAEKKITKFADMPPLGIIWDTVAASAVDQENEKDMSYTPHGTHSVKIGQGERRIVRLMSGLRICLILTNQIRENVTMGGFGKKLRSGLGERPLSHYAAMRVSMIYTERLSASVDGSSQVLGRRIQVKCKKNKVGGMPERKVELHLFHRQGFSQEYSILEALFDLNLATRTGRDVQLQIFPFNILGLELEFKDEGIRHENFRDFLDQQDMRQALLNVIRWFQHLVNDITGHDAGEGE